jgi:hypothetical protein
MRIELPAFALLFCSASFASSRSLELGGIVLELSDAPTAQIFHIVDQLSQWNAYAHKQYVRWADRIQLLDQRDRELLVQHSKMRKERGSGHAFDQAFLVEDSIENAATKAIAEGLLSKAEANTERDILLHFGPKLQPLLQQRQMEITRLVQQLESERLRLTPIVRKLGRFAEVEDPPTVMAFLVANPDDRNGGGEANGGRLVFEVPSPDAIGNLLHESLHRLLESQHAAIKLAAEAVALDFTALNEGIAYALYPGITADTEEGDRLIEQLVRMQLRGTPASNRYLQFNLIAAVIRPLLRAALARNETITTLLPKATAKWREIAPR